MVHLYNRLGDRRSFSASAWKEVLDNAGANGWQARGTVPPPPLSRLDAPCSETVTWDGNYTRPLGQTVTPDDASALAAAIEKALLSGADWSRNRRSALRAFTSFCRQRGFLVSSQAFTDPSAMTPAARNRTHYKIAS